MGIDFNIDKLLEPYEEGGTEREPIKLSLRAISNALIVRDKFPPDIAGAAIWKVFDHMATKGLEFKGNGSYGSKGDELFSCIKAQAVDMIGKKAEKTVKSEIVALTACVVNGCPKRTKTLRKLLKWDRFVLFVMKPRGFWRL